MKRWVPIGLLLLLGLPAWAEEGMWTMDNFPSAEIKKRYGFGPDQAWLKHAQLSSVRLAQGCSGSFVSPDGLVMTNHHCAHSCIEQLSNKDKDFVKSGFYAAKLADEVKCPALEVNQLIEISDVTARVTKATQGLAGEAFSKAQKGEMSKIEKECASSDEVRCDVVTLYNGGKYDLYKYRRYQDVRLVFAPEFATAFFGGDPDNFMFPRFDLDVSFVRVYQGDQPAKVEHYFKWSKGGAKAGELTFVTGHPGGTSRQDIVAQLEYQRDVYLREALLILSELRGMLGEFQNRGAEQKRFSTAWLFYVENGFKALNGMQKALLQKTMMDHKIADEKALRQKIAKNPKLKKEVGDAFEAIEKAEGETRDLYDRLRIEFNGIRGDLYGIAIGLVRAADELPKPNEQRLREYADSNLPMLQQKLFSPAPIHDELEVAMLNFSFTKLRERLGPDDPLVKKILGEKSPEELAAALVKGCTLKDVAARKKLFEGGKAAIEASQDPMILLARLVDPEARAVRKQYEDGPEATTKKASEKIAKARFALYGTKVYPDATFTLRISVGRVQGWKEKGQEVPPFTTLAGAFARATGRDPFALPKSWLDAKDKLQLDTPFDFCSTNDIIGGNSGSPVINQAAEVVGLIFDGNLPSLGGDYGFDESNNRAVAVSSEALIEALTKIYGAERIVGELRPKAP